MASARSGTEWRPVDEVEPEVVDALIQPVSMLARICSNTVRSRMIEPIAVPPSVHIEESVSSCVEEPSSVHVEEPSEDSVLICDNELCEELPPFVHAFEPLIMRAEEPSFEELLLMRAGGVPPLVHVGDEPRLVHAGAPLLVRFEDLPVTRMREGEAPLTHIGDGPPLVPLEEPLLMRLKDLAEELLVCMPPVFAVEPSWMLPLLACLKELPFSPFPPVHKTKQSQAPEMSQLSTWMIRDDGSPPLAELDMASPP